MISSRWWYHLLVLVATINSTFTTVTLPTLDDGYMQIARLCAGDWLTISCDAQEEMIVMYGGEQGYTASFETSPVGEVSCPSTLDSCTQAWYYDGPCTTDDICSLSGTAAVDTISSECAQQAGISTTNFLLINYNCINVNSLGAIYMDALLDAVASEGYLVTPEFPQSVAAEDTVNCTCALSPLAEASYDVRVTIGNLHTRIYGTSCSERLQITDQDGVVLTSRCSSDYAISEETYLAEKLYINYQKTVSSSPGGKIWLAFQGRELMKLQCWSGAEPTWAQDNVLIVNSGGSTEADQIPIALYAGSALGGFVLLIVVIGLVYVSFCRGSPKSSTLPIIAHQPPPSRPESIYDDIKEDEIASTDGYQHLQRSHYTLGPPSGGEHGYEVPSRAAPGRSSATTHLQSPPSRYSITDQPPKLPPSRPSTGEPPKLPPSRPSTGEPPKLSPSQPSMGEPPKLPPSRPSTGEPPKLPPSLLAMTGDLPVPPPCQLTSSNLHSDSEVHIPDVREDYEEPVSNGKLEMETAEGSSVNYENASFTGDSDDPGHDTRL